MESYESFVVTKKRSWIFYNTIRTFPHENGFLWLHRVYVIGTLNVNSLRNKIGAVEEFVTNNTDICLLLDTKIDESFPNQEFYISNYKTFRRDRKKHGGGLLFYINEKI